MKKLNLIKKMMLIASTAFMASSLVFVPGVQNKEVKLNKNKNFTAKTVILKNEARDIKYICQTMEFNEKWLEVTDVQRISGATDKFTEIDFSDLTVEGDSSDYELKSININGGRVDEIYDYPNLTKIEMGYWKWVKITEELFRSINAHEIDLRMNVGKEIFDNQYINSDTNFYIYFNRSNFKSIRFVIEQHETYSVLFNKFYFYFVSVKKIIFEGAKMCLDYFKGKYDNLNWGLNVNDIIFNNQVNGLNLKLFAGLANIYNGKTKIIFNNTTENFDLYSADYWNLDNQDNYYSSNSADIFIPNKSTKINLKKYKFEPQEKYSEWFWALNEKQGINKITLNITQDAYDAIQADPVQKERWEQAKIAGNKRVEVGNDVPWYQIIETPKLTSIKSTLVVPETTKANVGDTIDFNLTFTGEDGYFIDKESIKLFEKSSEGTTDKIVNNENYSLVINDVDDNPNKKVAKVTFLKPYNYKKLVFNYVVDETNIIRDSSVGVDIEVIGSDPGPTPDESSSNSNNLIIIGASAGAGALVASTATGFIISKKTKRGKQL